jgi:hypothetical protein
MNRQRKKKRQTRERAEEGRNLKNRRRFGEQVSVGDEVLHAERR